jgi:hypothetical protein
MCVILACENERPDLKTLLACERENPHGGGIAWRQNGIVKFRKGIDAKEILNISNKVELPFVIHFRIATAGGMSPKMCHPFPVGGSVKMHGNANSVLFHNGHWNDWEEVFLNALVAGNGRRLPTDDVSDTRAISIMLGWYGKNVLKLIKGQRFVYFSAKDFELHGYWTKRGGIQYSNMHWDTQRASHWNGHHWNDGRYGGYGYGGQRTEVATTAHQTPQPPALPAKSAAESATVFQSARAQGAKALGVTEKDLEDLEARHGIKVDSKGQLIGYNDSVEGAVEVEVIQDAEDAEKVVVGTFGQNNVARRLEFIRAEIADVARQKDLATERELQGNAEVVGIVRQIETLHKSLKERGLMVQMCNDGSLEAKLRPDATRLHKTLIAAQEMSDVLIEEVQGEILSNPAATDRIVRGNSRTILKIRLETHLASKGLME